MKKYQIKEVREKFNHAGSKAVDDICDFANELDYKTLYIRRRKITNGIFDILINHICFFYYWLKVYFTIDKNSIILVQNPSHRRQLGRKFSLTLLKKIKKCYIISVIHDVEKLRLSCLNSNSKSEYNFMLKNSNCFIVHNDKMKNFFEKEGINKNNLISLEIFDYSFNNFDINNKVRNVDIVIAGNLSKKKSPYIYKLNDLDNKITVNLYGPFFEDNQVNNIDNGVYYKGSFPAEQVPNIIDGKFGLIWDGNNIEICSGNTGNYLKYNDPHKTSLYLVSRIPIIVWEKAAIANFVNKEGIGICIESLEDIREVIDNITESSYNNMLKNTDRIAKKLENGYYIKSAIKKCEMKRKKEQLER